MIAFYGAKNFNKNINLIGQVYFIDLMLQMFLKNLVTIITAIGLVIDWLPKTKEQLIELYLKHHLS